MRRLKLFFACLLMTVLSIGQMWAVNQNFAFSTIGSTGWTNSYTNHNVTCTDGTVSMNASKQTSNITDIPVTKGQPVSFVLSDNTKSLSAVSFECRQWTTKAQTITLHYSTNGGSSYTSTGITSSNFSISSSSLPTGTNAVKITFSTTNNQVGIASMSYTLATVQEPTVTATSVELENTAYEDQVVALTYSNLGGVSVSNVTATLYDNEECTTAFTGGWLNDVKVASNKQSVSFDASANTGVARVAYMKIQATVGTKSPSAIISISQAKYSAPTGIFELFSGDIEEGDYVIYYGGGAMNTTVSSNRLQYLSVTPVEDKIENPDEAIIWHISASGDYWTLYNTAAEKYAGSTSTKNQGAVLASVTDYAKWSITGSSTYDFENLGRATGSSDTGNKWLRKNGTYGFACYSSTQSGTGPLTLYKKSDGRPAAGLAYAEADLKKLTKLGETFTAPTLSTADGFNGTVTYASSNTEVAEVAANGAVTIKAVGVAEITASFAGNENFKSGSASYKIGVTNHAGTEADPYNAIDTKNVIDVMGTKPNAYVSGKISSIITTSSNFDAENGYIWFYISDDGATTGQQIEAFKCLGLSSAKFTAVTDVVEGATVIITGTLKKYQSTYELDQDCYLVSYTAPEEPKTPIVSDIDNPITVANAITYIDAPATYDLSQAVWVRGVVTNIGQTNGQTPIPYIDVKDANAENSFRFFNYTINASITEEPQAGDILIATGLLDKYNSTYELNGCEVVDLDRPAVDVESVNLVESTALVGVGETLTLHATVLPGNASNKGITWSVQSGNDKAEVDANGVVTGIAGGQAVVRAASAENASIFAECTVTVDPTLHKVTFDATVDISEEEASITKGGITITASKFNNDEEGKYYYQCYANTAMTVSSTVGNITKIELTCTASGTAKYGPGNWDFTGYSYSGANGSWTGSAETVEFGNASQQVRMTLITVTYKEDSRAEAGLAWNPAEDIEITVKDAFSAPELQNPNSIDAAEISIESSNTSLATVTAGVVSLVANATGTAKITATFDGNDNYKPAVVSYTITVNEAGLDNVTFDATVDVAGTNEKSITKGGFTLAFTDGALDNGENYRLYKSNTMTLSSTDYLIKKIEFTCTTDKPITGFADATGLDKDNNEWTGESNTVELTASNAQVRMTKIKVFYVEDTRAAAGLAWNPAEDITLTVGDAFSAPALQNPNSIAASEITIESSKTTVATVSEGVVSLVADATGSTTITATFAGNATYKPATVSYKITVNPAYSIYVSPSLNVNFGSVDQDAEVADKKVTVTFTNVPAATLTLAGAGASAFTISPADAMTASGDITISASSANVGTFAATLTISDDDNNAESKTVNLSITVNEPSDEETPVSTTSKWVPATEIADGMQVLITGVKSESTYAMGASSSNGNNRTSVAGSFGAEDGAFVPGEGTMSFTLVATGAANTYYIKTSNNQYLYNASSSTKSYLKTKAEQEDVSWTIELDGDNNAVITSVENTNRQIMRFNTNGNSDPLFNCYASGQQSIKLYVPKPATPEPPTPVYETVRSGLTAGNYYTVCWPKAMTAIQGGTLWSFAGKDANMAYLIQEDAPFEAGKPYIIYATADKLEAVVEGDDAAAGSNNGLYGTLADMTNQQLKDAGADYMLKGNQLRPIGGGLLNANRAYVKLSEISGGAPTNAPAHKVRAIPMQKDAATGIEDVQGDNVQSTKVLIDGQLFILRGEKMYNANGQLVK